MRELESRRGLGPDSGDTVDELPPADIVPALPEPRYRDYDDSQDQGEFRGQPMPDQQMEPADDLGPDLPQDAPGDWDEPPE